MLKIETLRFLSQLKKHNEKKWMDEHRKDYQQARSNFISLVEQLLKNLASSDPFVAELEATKCIFRINRDIRFSKDKSPYKTNFGAYFNPGGKKSVTAGYYLHIEPGKSFVGGGLYVPPPDLLRKVRQEIDYNTNEWLQLISSGKFKSLYGSLNQDKEHRLTRMPKEYEPTHPAADSIRLKSFVATVPLTDKQLTEPALLKEILNAFKALQPVILFLNRATEE